jgi:hypothetical protein
MKQIIIIFLIGIAVALAATYMIECMPAHSDDIKHHPMCHMNFRPSLTPVW